MLHTFPHVPQFPTEVSKLVSQSTLFLSQSANPVSQEFTKQDPVEHEAVPLAMLHVSLHAPQLSNVNKNVSHPSVGLLLQSL